MHTTESEVPFQPQSSLSMELLGPITADANGLHDTRLPGHPGRKLSDIDALSKFLLTDLCTQELDAIAGRLWIMTTYSPDNVYPVHAQQIRGRNVVAAEHPRLHLTWKNSQIFIKPLPKYLLSYEFWKCYLVDESSPLTKDNRQSLICAAKGLLRSYSYLVKHETDFQVAQSTHLLPKDITWRQFSEFMEDIHLISNAEVSPRYHYGELRLSRLNLYAPFLMHRARYEWGRPQYSTYFNQFYGHVLFIWATFSLLLNTIQVELAVESLVSDKWVAMWYMARYISIVCFALLILIVIIGLGGWFAIISREWLFALRVHHIKREEVPT